MPVCRRLLTGLHCCAGYLLRPLIRNRLRIERVALRSKAAPRSQLKLPAVHGASQHAILNLCEAREIGLQVRAAPMVAIAVAFPELLYCRFLGVVPLGILQAFGRQALEEVVNIFVVRSLALRLEAAGEENLVDPVLLVMEDAVFDQGMVYVKAVIPLFAIPCIYAARMVVKHNLLHVAIDQHAPIDPDTGQVSLL